MPLIYFAAVVTSFVGVTVTCGLIFIGAGTLPFARQRLHTNARSYEVRLMIVFDTSIDVVGVYIPEQELELHMMDDARVRKITFAVEPRQLALKVRLA
jgi:NADH/NAD ratio-sensing transcriptional regulator Rex